MKRHYQKPHAPNNNTRLKEFCGVRYYLFLLPQEDLVSLSRLFLFIILFLFIFQWMSSHKEEGEEEPKNVVDEDFEDLEKQAENGKTELSLLHFSVSKYGLLLF